MRNQHFPIGDDSDCDNPSKYISIKRERKSNNDLNLCGYMCARVCVCSDVCARIYKLFIVGFFHISLSIFMLT